MIAEAEVAKGEPMASELIERPATTPLAILQTAVERGTDPGQLEKLLELQERWERNEAGKQFAAALAKFQARCPQIMKNRSIDLGGGKGPQYASLDDIMKVISPILEDCGLAVSFSATVTDGGMCKATCFVRCGMHVETSECALPVPSGMKVNATQQMGAALSYAKRYAICAALNIVVTDEDNDGANLGTGDEMELVTSAQADDLVAVIKAKGRTVDQFIEWANKAMGVDITSINELTVGKYREAKGMLRGGKR